MQQLFSMLLRISATELNVLIEGPPGSGKSLIARFIQQASHLACKPFVTFDCNRVPAELLESKLFGAGNGAPTPDEPCALQQARGGTLLLLAPEKLSKTTQAKLVRVLEDRWLRGTADAAACTFDVRVLAESTCNLRQSVAMDEFRRSLLDVLSEVRIDVPPLRERKGDLRLLVETFRAANPDQAPLSERALRKLQAREWPDNVRELQDALK
jgi:DNA-binding NtrC family response regulator